MAYGFEAGEAVFDLGVQLRVGGLVFAGGGQGDLDFMALGDAGDSGAGSFRIRGDGDGADEAEVDDVAWEDRVIAVAEDCEDVGLGEHLCR